MTTNILAVIGATVLILQAATNVPRALANLLRSCHQVLTALRALRGESENPDPDDQIDRSERDPDETP